jgi:hypothetical protein
MVETFQAGQTYFLAGVVGDCGRVDTYWNLDRGPITGPNVRPRAVDVPEVPRPTPPYIFHQTLWG